LIELHRLIVLQAVFAHASISYLLLSAWRLQATGEALSTAAIGPFIRLFIAYSLALSLPRFGFERACLPDRKRSSFWSWNSDWNKMWPTIRIRGNGCIVTAGAGILWI
jgi:hypothetical protein